MKLVSLNIWGGRVFDSLNEFITQQAKDTDIFCFQEVLDTKTDNKITHEQRADIFSVLKSELVNSQAFFKPVLNGFDFEDASDFPLEQGLAIFIKDSIPIKEQGEVFVYKSRNQHSKEDLWKDSFPKSLQYINFINNDNEYWIGNLHGIWTKEDTDTEPRVKQSEKIVSFFKSKIGKKILCGDFNLSYSNKSLEILEAEMRNLIKEYKVSDTRGTLYKKENRFADYVLVSQDLKVKDFQVPQVKVSDHLPMILEFE